jgi:hypothetical protein
MNVPVTVDAPLCTSPGGVTSASNASVVNVPQTDGPEYTLSLKVFVPPTHTLAVLGEMVLGIPSTTIVCVNTQPPAAVYVILAVTTLPVLKWPPEIAMPVTPPVVLQVPPDGEPISKSYSAGSPGFLIWHT